MPCIACRYASPLLQSRGLVYTTPTHTPFLRDPSIVETASQPAPTHPSIPPTHLEPIQTGMLCGEQYNIVCIWRFPKPRLMFARCLKCAALGHVVFMPAVPRVACMTMFCSSSKCDSFSISSPASPTHPSIPPTQLNRFKPKCRAGGPDDIMHVLHLSKPRSPAMRCRKTRWWPYDCISCAADALHGLVSRA